MYAQDAPRVVAITEKSTLAPLHAINVLLEACVLFLCSGGNREDMGEFFCGNTFALGSGGMVSLVALLTHENDSPVALHSVTWYQLANVVLHIKRMFLASSSESVTFSREWINVVTLANALLFIAGVIVLTRKSLLKWDTIGGIVCAALFLAIAGDYTAQSESRFTYVYSILKSIPVLLMAQRVHRSSSAARNKRFQGLVAAGLLVCSIADFAIDVDFLFGLLTLLFGHLCFCAAFTLANPIVGLARAPPIFGYATVVYSILFPRLGQLAIPTGVYVAVIAVTMWRATLVGLNKPVGRTIALGTMLFALSDTLIALDKFVNRIENARYVILGTYWLGQFLIAQGALQFQAEEQTESEAEVKSPKKEQ